MVYELLSFVYPPIRITYSHKYLGPNINELETFALDEIERDIKVLELLRHDHWISVVFPCVL